MKHLIFIITFSIVFTACNNSETSKKVTTDTNITDTPTSTHTVEAKINNQPPIDTSIKEPTKKSPEDILKFIANFSEREFRDMRKELIEQGAEHQYQISPIKKLGSILKYDVVIPGIEGKMEYTCNPQRGELTIIMVGDKDVAQMHFQQNKVGLNWENCNTTDVAEQCDTYQDWQEYPLKTHFTVSLVNQGSIAVFTFHRQIIPK